MYHGAIPPVPTISTDVVYEYQVYTVYQTELDHVYTTQLILTDVVSIGPTDVDTTTQVTTTSLTVSEIEETYTNVVYAIVTTSTDGTDETDSTTTVYSTTVETYEWTDDDQTETT